jgi:hypothetical protein
MPLLLIQTVEDLKQILFAQKTITKVAMDELNRFSEAMLPPDGAVSEDLMYAELQLLEKYCSYPTLTEWVSDERLGKSRLTKWGSTFGVSVLVNQLILEQIKPQLSPKSPLLDSVRVLYILLLEELAYPKHQYLVEALEERVFFEANSPRGLRLNKREQQIHKRELLTQFIEIALFISECYGIVAQNITSLGMRVMLHLRDAMICINDLTEAHKRFQGDPAKHGRIE